MGFSFQEPTVNPNRELIVATGYRLKNAGTARFLPHFVRDRLRLLGMTVAFLYPFRTRFLVSLILKDIPGSFCEFSILLSHISLGAVPVSHDNGASAAR